GNAWGIPFTLSKALTLGAGSRTLEIAYKLTGLPADFRQHLAIEFNFAGMPDRAEGRFFYDDARKNLGELGTRLDLAGVRTLGLVDDWLGIDSRLSFADSTSGATAGVLTFPIQSVSQSEGGFELVHQSVCVMPHWIVTPDRTGTWQVVMRLSFDGSRDGTRNEAAAAPHTGQRAKLPLASSNSLMR
ncbi:MAG: alpha-amylase/4-alpha-glucanotransferase domain-containing protein, partial [Planctomycetia bacterium]